jgi:hypothetical protein
VTCFCIYSFYDMSFERYRVGLINGFWLWCARTSRNVAKTRPHFYVVYFLLFLSVLLPPNRASCWLLLLLRRNVTETPESLRLLQTVLAANGTSSHLTFESFSFYNVRVTQQGVPVLHVTQGLTLCHCAVQATCFTSKWHLKHNFCACRRAPVSQQIIRAKLLSSSVSVCGL